VVGVKNRPADVPAHQWELPDLVNAPWVRIAAVAATSVSTVIAPRVTVTNGLTATAVTRIGASASEVTETEIADVAISAVTGLNHRAPSRLVEKLRVTILRSPSVNRRTHLTPRCLTSL
jgi:hypothetical protein